VLVAEEETVAVGLDSLEVEDEARAEEGDEAEEVEEHCDGFEFRVDMD
jgi:hypothetical protein